jgi:pre-mRNA-processing factor 19
MSFNICALSGNIIEVPVVSKTTGHVFERRLIEKHIDATGQCPITGDEMTRDSLLEIQVSKGEKPRTISGSSIPGVLTTLQNEWDGLMLETFNMKQQLDLTRQELSHSLYQHDASCRVIARLIRERDDIKNSFNNLKANMEDADEEDLQDEEFTNMGIYEGLVERMTDLSNSLSELRKGNKLVTKELSTQDVRISINRCRK